MMQALQLLLSLIILVVLHELGHFIPAKLFKTKVEKFYLFFDPWFSLFKFKRGDTEYGIGWLPLGGYVKISGMIDESMDKKQMALPPQSWEFRSKPVWQRFIIMVGGVTVNVILGVLIYAMVLFTWGKEYLPVNNMKYGVACDSLAMKIGFKDGDKILSVDGEYVEALNKVPVHVMLNKATSIQVERDGEKKDIPVNEDDLSEMIGSKSMLFAPRVPCEVDTILPAMPAEKAGLKKGDVILSINDAPTPFLIDVQRNMRKNKSQEVSMNVLRGKDTLAIELKVSEDGTIGFGNKAPGDYLDFKKVEYSFFEAFPAGMQEGYEKIIMQVKTFVILFTVKDAHKSLGGFYSIASAYDPSWNWQVFWTFTAFLSVVLAFMNILPIPALDGGYILFLFFEMISRKKVPDKVIEYANYVGFFLLLTLMIYANTDFLRH